MNYHSLSGVYLDFLDDAPCDDDVRLADFSDGPESSPASSPLSDCVVAAAGLSDLPLVFDAPDFAPTDVFDVSDFAPIDVFDLVAILFEPKLLPSDFMLVFESALSACELPRDLVAGRLLAVAFDDAAFDVTVLFSELFPSAPERSVVSALSVVSPRSVVSRPPVVSPRSVSSSSFAVFSPPSSDLGGSVDFGVFRPLSFTIGLSRLICISGGSGSDFGANGL